MLQRSIDILRDLVAFPTISTASNLEIIAYLTAHFERLGARCLITKDESGAKANLFASMGPDTPGGVLLSGHTDVVPVADQDWSTDPFVMVERDGKLYGRGTCDMKGFVAASLAFAEELGTSSLNQPLHFAFTYDEETGCLGAQNLVMDLAARGIFPKIAIVGEPTEMAVIEGHKGCYEYTARFTGVEGHGSSPETGVNAAEYACRYVAKLLELREAVKARAPAASQFDPPWTTLNVGRIVGGVAHNVIVGKAQVDWEMRPVQIADGDFVKDEMDAFVANDLLPSMRAVSSEAKIEVETIAEVVGLDPRDENAARDLLVALTGANDVGLVPFGTEAGLFQELGTHVVVCGPGSIDQAHRPDEFLAISQLDQCCRMLQRLGAHLDAR